MESALKMVRIVWIALLLASCIYVWLPEEANVQPKDLNSTFYTAFVALLVVMLGVIVFVRKMTIGVAEPMIRANSNDATALQKWRAGQIVTVALCEAIVLYGLVLRFVGATKTQAAPFYVVGIAAMLVFWPKPVQ